MGSVMGSESTSSSRSAPGTNGSTVGQGHLTYARRAHHAGSWYEDDATALRDVLDSYLREALEQMPSLKRDAVVSSAAGSGLRGVIVPHAGYRYSGPTAAYAYAALQRHIEMATAASSNDANGDGPIVIVVLHPSHHVYMEGCAVSGAHELQTPLGSLVVDDKLRTEILQLTSSKSLPRAPKGPGFTLMSQRDDEHEHSGEMQYPFLAHVLSLVPHAVASVLPIMVGSISPEHEERFGRLLSPILARPNVLTVISSDFCHWGSRFSYRPTPQSAGATSTKSPIHEFILQLDRDGMDLIERQQPGAFARYLRETKNTICGRHPISVWLNAITAPDRDHPMDVHFVKYAQSSAVTAMHESSVSYAAALATVKQS